MELSGKYPHSPQSYMLWDIMSEYGILPYSGGYMDQPQWFDDDVAYFTKRQRLIDLEVKIEQHREENAGKQYDNDNDPILGDT